MFLNIYLFILGTVFGSFLNVLIDRLPQEETIGGRSHCDSCKKKLKPFDLIPVFSFLFLKGKCRYCGTKLSWFYPFFELLTGVIFVLTWNYFPTIGFIHEYKLLFLKGINLAIVSTLLVIFFADLKYQIIPDSMQVSLFLFTSVKYILIASSTAFVIQHLLAGLAIMSPILAIFLFTRGQGMGFGDVKLAYNIGFIVGYLQGFLALYIGFITGALFGLSLLIFKRKKLKSAIAFGPFLILGLTIMMIWGEGLAQNVLSFYGF